MSQKRAKGGRGTMSRRIARMEAERRRAARRRLLVRGGQIGIPIVVVVVGLLLFFSLRGGKNNSASSETDVSKSSVPTTTTTTLPAITPTVTTCAQATSTITDSAGVAKPQFPTPPVLSINLSKAYVATFETNKGTIQAQLSPTIAPVTVNNFVFLARCGFYDGTKIHRVAKEFVIQGGDPTGTGSGGPGYEIPDEFPPTPGYAIGSLAMANTGQPNSGGSQFFIVTGNKVDLPNKYSLFGYVIAGQDVAKTIEQLPSDAGDDGPPKEPVIVTKVTIEER